MKKTLFLILTLLLLLVSCSKNEEQNSQKTITISNVNAKGEKVEITLPFNPKKAAVLDLATLDIFDELGLEDKISGVAKAFKLDHLSKYFDNNDLIDLGSIREVNLENLQKSEPDVIFIGKRLLGQYDELQKIAPVVVVMVNYDLGIVNSTKQNVDLIAKIYGKEKEAKKLEENLDKKVEALRKQYEGKTALVGLVTSSSFNTLGDKYRGTIIGVDLGFKNLASEVTNAHGNETSFEQILAFNPEYIFVLDRDTAINVKGAKLAQEILDNELVKKTKAYQNDNIIYVSPAVWYLSEGGIQATNIMLDDISKAK